jgi:hypothetical protein
MAPRRHSDFESTNPLSLGGQVTHAGLKIGTALGVVGFLIWFYLDMNVVPYYPFLGILNLSIGNSAWFVAVFFWPILGLVGAFVRGRLGGLIMIAGGVANFFTAGVATPIYHADFPAAGYNFIVPYMSYWLLFEVPTSLFVIGGLLAVINRSPKQSFPARSLPSEPIPHKPT